MSNTTLIKDIRTVLEVFANYIIAYTKDGKTDYPDLFKDTEQAIQTYIDNKILEARIATLENVQDTYRNSESLFPLLLRSLIKELKSNQSKG